MLHPGLAEASEGFLATLSQKQRSEFQKEVSRFVRWCGRDRAPKDLAPLEVANYAEQVARGSPDFLKRLEPLRAFFTYLHREKLTSGNLASHLRAARRANSKTPRAASRRGSQEPEQLTEEGYLQLKEELEALKQDRIRITEEVGRAMADKDFRENAPLDAAKEEQGRVEVRIRELEQLLQDVQLLNKDSEERAQRARMGARVTVRDLQSGATFAYLLVNPREVDPSRGKISIASPIGRALLERTPGETVEVRVPAGTVRYKVEHIES